MTDVRVVKQIIRLMKDDVVHKIPGIRIVGIRAKVESGINGDHLDGLPKRLKCSVKC